MSHVVPARNELPLVDADVDAIIAHEIDRQNGELQMIASENSCSTAVLEAMGSALNNKYAEGYPGRRYYSGCRWVDQVEELAIARVKELFGADHANVQPHAGSSANQAAYFALCKPRDTILGLRLDHGGHLTHGHSVNFSGMLYNFVSYGVSESTGLIEYDRLRDLALEKLPRLIVTGASAYPRRIDFAAVAEIAREVSALHMADIAHYAGLVATGLYPSPVRHADIVTSTTHKTLRGPRGGFILCRDGHARAVDKSVFPGLQGGPLEHVIAGKAVCFKEAMSPAFKEYQERVMANAKVLGDRLMENGFDLVSGGTDCHLLLVDLRRKQVTGKAAASALERAGITANHNTVPGDPRPPTVTSGLRLGTPSLTTRGLGLPEMKAIADWIAKILAAPDDESVTASVRRGVSELCLAFPLYEPR